MVRARDLRFGDQVIIAGIFRRVIRIDQDYFHSQARYRFQLDGDEWSPYFMGACMLVKSLEADLPQQQDADTVTPAETISPEEHPVQ